MSFRCLAVTSWFLFLCNVCAANSLSIGPNGINSAILQSPGINLTGANIGIGQVEIGRPTSIAALDPPEKLHANVNPTGVYRQAGPSWLVDADEHALNVAGIMISQHPGNLAGVAKDARLYASAFGTDTPSAGEVATTINFVATRHLTDPVSPRIRAVNHSYGVAMAGNETTNGNSYITMALDWSASAHNALHVVGGTDGEGNPLPTDNFNGMTLGYSEQFKGTGSYRKVGAGNTFFEDADGDRTSIDLLAPGAEFPMTNPNTTSTVAPHPRGTSYAAPHVTGTVALLQQYADAQIANVGGVHWGNTTVSGPTAQRHEVMKAVLLNSADKISGVHGSSRTVVANDNFGNYDWEHSPAYFNPAEPLDIQMGAGHLNAQRAATQFAGGEWDNDSAEIPLIGWDYGETGGPGTTLRYSFQEQLAADGYIAITMAWYRQVENFSGTYVNNGFNDLDVFLVPEGQDINQAVAYSISTVDTVEHIFAKVPSTGNYDILVYQ